MSTASLPVYGECPTHGRTLHGSLSGDCSECTAEEEGPVYNGHVITDLTVDETGRFPVDEDYYPQRVRDAVNQGENT